MNSHLAFVLLAVSCSCFADEWADIEPVNPKLYVSNLLEEIEPHSYRARILMDYKDPELYVTDNGRGLRVHSKVLTANLRCGSLDGWIVELEYFAAPMGRGDAYYSETLDPNTDLLDPLLVQRVCRYLKEAYPLG